MPQLSSKHEAFVEMMKEDEESARRGFELLATYPDLDMFFDALKAAGFFDPDKHPAIRPAPEDPGCVQVPYWSALEYLVPVARLADKQSVLDLAAKVLNVVREVCNFREPDGNVRDNHITFAKFAEILGLMPSSLVLDSDLAFIPTWLESRFSHGMVAHALNKGILPKLLHSDIPADWTKACVILRHCTEVRRDDPTRTTSFDKYKPVVEDYWLKELIKNNIDSFASKAAPQTCNIFIDRLRQIFSGDRDKFSHMWRPAIEDHGQNHQWNEPENILVEGLRDTLLQWIDRDATAATGLVKSLLHDQSQILRRIGIYLLEDRWEVLGDQYSDIVSSQLFDDSGHLHELYRLLQNHFATFTDRDKAATLDAIKQLPLPDAGSDSEFALRLTQRNWLSAIANKGFSPADALYIDLSSDPKLGSLREHPDFQSYMTASVGWGPTPFQAQELIAFAKQGTLIEKLNGFQQPTEWRGPSRRALTDTLEEAVKHEPQLFVRILPTFLTANRAFQYGIINGFKALWDAPEGSGPVLDWNHIWNQLIGFFEKVILPESFWAEKPEEPHDFHLTPNHDWIPRVVADFLQAGTRTDDHAYPSNLLPRTWKLIEVLVQNLEPTDAPGDDPMFRAINTQKGRAIEALFVHTLRSCRVSDQARGDHTEVWASMEPLFDVELDKCKNANYEFSTLLGHYIAHLQYMSPAWTQRRIQEIFPEQYRDNYNCALEGLAYAAATRPLYSLLEDNGIVDKALHSDLEGRQLREKLIERIALAYLWGEESLDSPRFSYLFETANLKDLQRAAELFWGVSGQALEETQITRIIDFWKRCISLSSGITDAPKLLAVLASLSVYLTSLGEEEMTLLRAVAPHVYLGHHADIFIEELARLVNMDPARTATILELVLNSYTPMFDYEDRLKSILVTLHRAGDSNKIKAIELADKLRLLPGMIDLYNEFTSGT